jgi:very-short-patch-repair endonuclease
MREEGANADSLIASVAERQHGVITAAQLIDAGVDKSAVSRRARAGRLHRLHRGVYAVGHRAIGSKGRWLAAVLACGEGAVLSHVSAAGLWELLPPVLAPVHVTIPTEAGRRHRPGILLHRSPHLPEGATTCHHGIAVTTPMRTISDLSQCLEPAAVRQAIREAEARGLDLGPNHRSDRTKSELEYLFLSLCRRHRLPAPEVNVRVDRFLVDFLWPEQRLVVETDGWRYHGGSIARAEDNARDARLQQLGFEVLRFTYWQVVDEPARVAAAVRGFLGR